MLRRPVLASLLTILCAVFTAPTRAHAADPVPGDPLAGSGSVNRTVLTAAELTSGSATGTVFSSAFALPDNAAPPGNEFEGTLTLNNLATSGGFTTIRDEYGYAGTEGIKHLPPFGMALVQNGSHLIPAVRGLQITGSPYWNLVVQPGRVWNESGDGGMSRASLPFAIVERNANCTHNGLLTFLFDDTSVSQARYQITNETCKYFQFDMWGQVPVTYNRGAVAGAEGLRNAYAAEVSARLPIKPISALATDYPSSGVDVSTFGAGITASAMSTYGVTFNGVNYVAGCHTRQGPHPFCGQMLLPSYSLAKTMFHGVAFMRLAQFYGSSIVNELISAHVSEATGAAWSGVTFQHVADMATGNYTSGGFEADEAGAQMSDFFIAESYADKMSTALAFPHKTSPGTKWVYHSSDSFILSRAMQNYLGVDPYTWLRDQVLAPLKLGPDALTTVRTGNSGSGTPLGGYGLFYTQDDIAKVSRFLNSGNGQIAGTQILHPTMLANAMQRNPSQRGLNTGPDPSGVSYQYHDGIWARRFTSADHPVFGSETYVPFMSGFGGITVAMLPNGANYYYFSDNGEFSWTAAAAEAQKLTSSGGGCAPAQLIGNGGFETGSATPWTATAGVVTNSALQPARTGSWKAWLDGYGYTVTETLTQQVSIPAGCVNATLAFYLHIDTAETQNVIYDTMVLDVAGTSIASWSNLDDAPGYTLHTFDLSAWAGQALTLRFTGSEDYSLQTSFVIDDVTLTVA